MIRPVIIASALATLPLLAEEMRPAIRYDAILQVESEAIDPDYSRPWDVGTPSGGSGTGFLIGPNRILTNAHVVSNARRLTIRRFAQPDPLRARVVAVAHDCDLALLELIDPKPLEGVTPFELDGVPELDTEVNVVGYPIGGDRLSVTRGVVSRIDFRQYTHSGSDQHLAIQIDAAINPGNSGGPVLQNGKVVGVAFQGYSGDVAQNVGYMIPVPVIQRLLKDMSDGKYDHYVDLAVDFFPIENPAQVKALGVPKPGFGVFVSSVNEGGSSAGVLQRGDVLLEIDGKPVRSNGLIELNGQLIDLNEMVERKFAGDVIQVKIWRDRKEEVKEIKLKRFLPYLMNSSTYDELPRYLVYAGLVFQPMDRDLLSSIGASDLTVRYFYGYYVERDLQKERPEPVVLTQILPDAINTYFPPFRNAVVDEIDGVKVKSLRHLSDLLDKANGDFLTIKFMDREPLLVMKRALIPAAQERIEGTYGLSAPSYFGPETSNR